MSLGRSIRLFLVDGTPNGPLTAEIMNWTGHVMTGPRSKLTELVQRPECARTGVYFLVGPDPENNLRFKVYVGESDNIAECLKQHNCPEEQGGQDFWEKVCLVTSKEQSLTKAHVKHLEGVLVRLVRHAGRCDLVNGTANDHGSLSEADHSDMLFFLEHVYTVLPVLGYDFLAPASEASVAPAVCESPLFILEDLELNLRALAKEIDGEFTVLKGSQAIPYRSDTDSSYQDMYKQLVKDEVLVPDGDYFLTFSKDQEFISSSAAASVICGRSVDGETTWFVDGKEQTYAAWQNQQLSGSSRVSYSSHSGWLRRVHR